MQPLTLDLIKELYQAVLKLGFGITIRNSEIVLLDSTDNCEWVVRYGQWVDRDN